MGMFGSSAPAIPMDAQSASYNPSALDIGLQMLFGHDTGGPADAAAHLRELHYQNAMRPIQAQAFQGWAGRFLGGQPQQPPQQAAAPAAQDPAAAPEPAQPATLQDAMAKGLGQAVWGSQPDAAPQPAAPPPTAGPLVPQVRRGNIVDINNPDDQSAIVGGKVFGMPGADTLLDIAKATQPDVQYDRGFGYNKKTGQAVGGFHPDLEKGQIPLYDTSGNLAGVKNLDGTIQSAQELAEATELGKTRGGMVTAPTGNGGSRMMTGAQYLDMTNPTAPVGGRRSGPVVPQIGAPAPAANGPSGQGNPGGFGYTPSPAEQELAKGRVATQVEREKLQPKEEGALRDLDSASSLTSNTIHQILGDVRDPKTGQWVKTGKSMAHWYTTGLGANLKNINGTPAHDLDELLEHVNAATSMANLQNLRDNSPTGAGLGRVTQTEIGLLAAMNGSTDQGQRGPQFEQNLRRQLEQLDAAVSNRHKVYQQTYGAPSQGGSAKGASPGYSRADLVAEARRRGLIK